MKESIQCQCLSIRHNKNHSSSKLVVCLNLVSFWIKRKKEKYKKNHIYICSIHQGGPVSKAREKHPGDEADLTWKTLPPPGLSMRFYSVLIVLLN